MSLLKSKIDIKNIPLYQGGESKLDQFSSVIKLSSNENPFGPSSSAINAYNEVKTKLHLYPDGSASGLKEALSEIYQVPKGRIICGAGSDEILCLACRAYSGPNDEIIHTQHAFSMYSIYAKSVGAFPVIAKEKNLTADIELILKCVSKKTKIVFLANPNNPTGTVLNRKDIVDLREALREDILLVLDGAYSEYMSQEDHDGALSLANTYENVLVTRTFSKIYGLAALRVGWGYGDISIIETLEKLRNPFNLNSPAIIAAREAVRDIGYTKHLREHNSQMIKEFIPKFRSLGLEINGEAANFILAKFPKNENKSADQADRFLRSSGIIVRRVNSYGLSDYLRITVGTKPQMNELYLKLKQFFEGNNVKDYI